MSNRHRSTLLAAGAAIVPMPRAIAGSRVRADGDGTKTLIAQIGTAVTDMRAEYDRRYSELSEAIEANSARSAFDQLHGGPRANFRPDDPEYSRLFASFFRGGGDEQAMRAAQAQGNRAQVLASMSVGSTSDGGYLAPTEWDRKINSALVALSPMRRLSSVQTTSVNAYSTLWNNKAWGSGWVGETAARPATATAQFSPLTFGHGEIYANAAATQRLLDDADMNMEQWLASEVSIEMDRQEGIAFLSGDGVNKPFGLLQYVTGGAAATQHPGGVLTVAPSSAAATIAPDSLIDFVYGLAAPYRQNATWLMASATAAAVQKLKDGQGNYLWRESFAAGAPPTLLGRPVEFDENMPALAAGNLAVAYGDFKTGYLINDRMGTRILRDPYTNKPYVMFYVTRRVGGGVKDPNAIRLLKIAAS